MHTMGSIEKMAGRVDGGYGDNGGDEDVAVAVAVVDDLVVDDDVAVGFISNITLSDADAEDISLVLNGEQQQQQQPQKNTHNHNHNHHLDKTKNDRGDAEIEPWKSSSESPSTPPPPPPLLLLREIWKETKLFLEVAIGACLMYIGFAALPLLTASCIGRWFGPVYLTAFSLANLTGNLSTQTLVFGILGAIDTLGPQAFGKSKHEEVGFLVVRGFVVSMTVLLPINILMVVCLEDALVALGEDPEAAVLANEWYCVYVLSLPFSVFYQALCKFLTSQNITAPIACVSVVTTVAIGPVLEFSALCGGYIGTAVAWVVFWALQSVLVLVYVVWKRPHDPRTWPGGGGGCTREKTGGSETTNRESNINNSNNNNINRDESSLSSLSLSSWSSWVCFLWRPSMEPRALREFVVLGLGGVVAQCEWVFWEALGLLVGKLGVLAMTAHTIPTQIVFSATTFPISCGVALAVRMGISLPKSVLRARAIALLVVGAFSVLSLLASFFLYGSRKFLIRFFLDENGDDDNSSNSNITATATTNTNTNINTSDAEEVFELADSIWPEVCVFTFNVALFGIMIGISSGLGKQWILAIINVFYLWIFGMPVIYYTAIVSNNKGDEDTSTRLKTIWFWMDVAYAGINITLFVNVFFCTDWYKIQESILLRGGVDSVDSYGDKTTTLGANGDRTRNSDITRNGGGDDDDDDNNRNDDQQHRCRRDKSETADECTSLLRPPSQCC